MNAYPCKSSKIYCIFAISFFVLHSVTMPFSFKIIAQCFPFPIFAKSFATIKSDISPTNGLAEMPEKPSEPPHFNPIVITDKGHVEHKKVVLEERVSVDEIKQTVDLINKLLVGTPIDEVSQRLEFEIKPIISKTIKQYEAVYEIFRYGT